MRSKQSVSFSKGDVVLVSFPFSDLVHAKKRPMVVVAQKGDDLIGCAVTSNPQSEGVLIASFAERDLPFKSRIKYWQIITFEKNVVISKVAKVSLSVYRELYFKITDLIKL